MNRFTLPTPGRSRSGAAGFRRTPATLAVLATLAGLAACSSLPQDNAALNQARSRLQAAQGDTRTGQFAAAELKQAADAVARAEAAYARGESTEEVDHMAYLANQRVGIADATTRQKVAEATSATAALERDRLRLAARTREADAAQQAAAIARQGTAMAEVRTDAAERQGEAAQRDALAARGVAREAQVRAELLERQLADLKARKTERGFVITIGDVLFDSNRAELRPGAARSMDQLVTFLNQYPQRRALVEGFTDSIGSDAANQALSDRRAGAVRSALVDRGVAPERVTAKGYGEAHPISGNDSAGGRQANRRVEILLSDDSGNIAAR